MARSDSTLAELAFERYRGGLQRYLMKRLNNIDDTQDLTQEVYLRLLRVEKEELILYPQAYVYRIASNVIYEFRLRESREKEWLVINSEVADVVSSEVSAGGHEEQPRALHSQREAQRLLSFLSATEKAIVVMQKQQGMSYAEIAEALDLSIHTVKKYLFRALLQLRKHAGKE